MVASFAKNDNESARIEWVKQALAQIPEGSMLLDVGAGECQYKQFCSHLKYVSQDVGEYDGLGDSSGLQTGAWDFSQIDLKCDVLDIPEDVEYDAVLCTEVLEHVPDPVRVLEKIVRLVKPGGAIIITAPFSSLTHFAPYHYATGFSSYFYKYHLPRLDCDIIELTPNGGYFDFLHQELGRTPRLHKKFIGEGPGLWTRKVVSFARKALLRAAEEEGGRFDRRSSELLTFGWHVVATKNAG